MENKRREEGEDEKGGGRGGEVHLFNTVSHLFSSCFTAVSHLFSASYLYLFLSLSGFNKNCSDSPIVKYKQTAPTADTISFVSSEHALISINLEF